MYFLFIKNEISCLNKENYYICIPKKQVIKSKIVPSSVPIFVEKSNQIIQLLKEISSKGTTVLIATHDYLIIKKHKARTVGRTDARIE